MLIMMHCERALGTSATRDVEHIAFIMADDKSFSLACRRAAEALQAMHGIANSDISKLASATATNQSTKQQGANPSSLSGPKVSNFRAELASRFPTFKASTENRTGKRTKSFKGPSKRGRPSGNVVHKDLIIIPDPKTDQVPTHSKRVELEQKGLVIHEFPFNKQWDPMELSMEIRKQLPDQDIMFEFVKACYGKLVLPKLAMGVEMSAEVLLKVSGQGAIYIRSLDRLDAYIDDIDDGSRRKVSSPLAYWSNDEFSESDDSDPPQILTPSGTTTIAGGPATATGRSATTTTNESSTTTGRSATTTTNESSTTLGGSATTTTNESATTPGGSATTPGGSATILDFERISHMLNTLSREPGELLLKKITLHRATLKDELIAVFKDPKVFEYMFVITLIGYGGQIEEGVGSGVLKEVLTVFWQFFSNSLSSGSAEKVPSVRHDYGKQEWEAIARILVYGYASVGYFPIMISYAFLCSVLFGEESVTKSSLMTSFRVFISEEDKETIDKVLNNDEFHPQDEDLLDLLSNYKCRNLPQNRDHLNTVLLELAHQEIIQKPRYVIDCFSPIVSYLRVFEVFQTVDGVQSLYNVKKPTAKNILRSFSVNTKNSAESDCLDFFRRFIRNLNKNDLVRFLQFLTGSDVIISDSVELIFTDSVGLSRRPIARTCGPTLELPSTYQTFNELSEEFMTLLDDRRAWAFTMA